jgi:hypothetical protein
VLCMAGNALSMSTVVGLNLLHNQRERPLEA